MSVLLLVVFIFFAWKKIDLKTVNLNNKKTHFSFFFRLTYLCIHKCVFQPGTTPLSFEICDKCGFEFRFISVAAFIRVMFIPLIRVGAHLFIYLFFPNSLSFILSFLFVFFLISIWFCISVICKQFRCKCILLSRSDCQVLFQLSGTFPCFDDNFFVHLISFDSA